MLSFNRSILFQIPILFILTSCGGSGGGGSGESGESEDNLPPLTDSLLLPVARCTALHVNALTRLVERMQNLFDVFNGAPAPAGVMVITPLSHYSFQLDLEPDGSPDITVDVNIVPAPGTNLSDGMQAVDSVTVNLMFFNALGGNPMFHFPGPQPGFNPGIDRLELGWGTGFGPDPVSLSDGGTCSFTATSIGISWDVGNTRSNSIVSASFSSSESADTFSGTLSKGSLEDIVHAAGQLVVGGNLPLNKGFAIDLDTFEVLED
ncbi:MAG: hypothetical protein OEU50_18345 [Gammaproteobacteria bacterium]|nr:hypothetical protein [Gammaproteobacteria bacterium]